jgi:hypothetical protein
MVEISIYIYTYINNVVAVLYMCEMWSLAFREGIRPKYLKSDCSEKYVDLRQMKLAVSNVMKRGTSCNKAVVLSTLALGVHLGYSHSFCVAL